MAEKNYQPPEDQIKALMRHDKRKLVVAYLRASRRARRFENSIKMVLDLEETMDALETGKTKKALWHLKKFEQTLNHMKEIGDA